PDRAALVEWRAYEDFHAEIQVRTVIQHAWSSISHALNYKQELAVPSLLQRRLNRIAGLFELADEEVVGIRDQRLRAQEEAAAAIAAGATDIPITIASITELLSAWKNGEAVEKDAESVGFSVDDAMEDKFKSQIYEVSKKIGLETIRDL